MPVTRPGVTWLLAIGLTILSIMGCSNYESRNETVIDQSIPKELAEKLALEYYSSTYGDAGVTVMVKDYGCHTEAFVLKGETIIKRLSINPVNYQVYEMG